MDLIHIKTSDDLRLQGVYYDSESRDVLVLFVHGMSGNSIENYFSHVLGKELAQKGFSFIYAHNRGYNHINDIATSELKEQGGYKTTRIGAVYERFKDSLLDIEAWMNYVSEMGYKKIILMGHSLGCNKTIYYFSQKKPSNVVGVILASPPDMVGLIKKPEYQPNSDQLFREAQENIRTGNPRKLLSSMIWDWYTLSSQTFIDLFSEGSEVDNLPLLRNPDEFSQLATINVPILGLMGENDDIAIKTLHEDLELIASKATSCPSFAKKHIPKASHTYDNAENELAQVVVDWIESLK